MHQGAMTPERWRLVNELFHSALEQGPGRRAEYLDQACGSDTKVRSEVESLLVSLEQTGYFIDRPAFHPISHFLYEDPDLSFLGKSIGRYTVLSMLGRGGMGEVYLA